MPEKTTVKGADINEMMRKYAAKGVPAKKETTIEPEPDATADEPVATADEPVATADEPVAAADEPALDFEISDDEPDVSEPTPQAPIGPNDIDQSIAPPEEQSVENLRLSGNGLFQASSFAAARVAYEKAVEIYDGRKGGDGYQRAQKVKLLGNLSETLLRLRVWNLALKHADAALELEPSNAKARVRRAKALSEIETVLDPDETVLLELSPIANTLPSAFKAAPRCE